MNTIKLKVAAIVLASILWLIYIIPWSFFWLNMPFSEPYKLGLDLHWWVELDYTVDIEEAKKRNTEFNEQEAIELLKLNLEKRIQTLSSSEATIATATYWLEKHIIVQIPTISFEWEDFSYIEDEYILKNNKEPDSKILEELIDLEKQNINEEYISHAKAVIWKVVRLEFKERKLEITEQDKKERLDLIEDIFTKIKESPSRFDILSKKYNDQTENVFFVEDSLVDENTSYFNTIVAYSKIENAKIWDILKIENTELPASILLRISPESYTWEARIWTSIIKITWKNKVNKDDSIISTDALSDKEDEKITQISYKTLFIDTKPSDWTVALTNEGKSLTDAYLISATASLGQGYSPQINLKFNPEWADIFKDLTTRLLKKQIAIFVWWSNLTAPTVQSVIPDWLAVISGDYTMETADSLSKDIMSWKVPAPIYLTSERSINAKLWTNSLEKMIFAWGLGLLLVFVFLIRIYRVWWAIAWVSLIIYLILTLSIVKLLWLVLSLSSIAWLVLSLWIAIDSNILIFERIKEIIRTRAWVNIYTAVKEWFEESWKTIWDANITWLITAIVLYSFWINLIKWFWSMLMVWIVVSLFVTMHVFRAFIFAVATRYEDNLKSYIWLDTNSDSKNK